METSTHLHFRGHCREAFERYAGLLGGRISFMMTHGETPPKMRGAPEWHDKVVHARVDFDGWYLLGTDPPPAYYRAPQGFNLLLSADTVNEVERIFTALAEGGTVTMPLQETFWSHRFGMCTDRFGIPWMVTCAKPLGAGASTAAPGGRGG